MAKRSSLGRGLEDILDEISETYESSFNEVIKDSKSEFISDIDLDLIEPNPYQPRKHFDENRLKELSESIKKYGLIQPVIVISHEDKYILVAGERRVRASRLANLSRIKAVVAPINLDKVKLRELALIENIQRENLNPIELATSYKELIDIHKITHEKLAKIVNKSRSQITNTLRLLNLKKSVQKYIIDGKISQGHAKILVNLDEKKQEKVVKNIIEKGLTVRETEAIIRKIKMESKGKFDKTFSISREKSKLIKKLLPFEIKIKNRSVEILLHNEEDLSNFIEFIKKA